MPSATAVMIQAGFIAASAVAFLYRLLPVIRNPRDGAARAVLCGLGCLVVIFLIGHPGLYWLAYHALGDVPALPQLLQHTAALVLAYYAEVFMILTATPADRMSTAARRVRGQRRLLGACAGGLVVCYAIGPLRLGLPIMAPAGSYDASIIAYLIAWQLYLAFVLVDVVRLSLRHVFAGRVCLRIGLRMLVLGCTLAIFSIIYKIGGQVAASLGASTHDAQSFLLAPVVASLLIGLVLPSVCVKAARYLAHRRAYRQLARLANDLCPEGARSGPMAGRGRRARVRSLIVDVRDTLIGPMRGYLDQDILRSARERARENGATEEHAQAIAEAACIAVAVKRRSSGAPELDSAPPLLAAPPDWESEMRWLAAVGRAYNSDAVVKEMVARSGL